MWPQPKLKNKNGGVEYETKPAISIRDKNFSKQVPVRPNLELREDQISALVGTVDAIRDLPSCSRASRIGLLHALVPPLLSKSQVKPKTPPKIVKAKPIPMVGNLTEENEKKMYERDWDGVDLTDVMTPEEQVEIQKLLYEKKWSLHRTLLSIP